jgi:hypothetical protein
MTNDPMDTLNTTGIAGEEPTRVYERVNFDLAQGTFSLPTARPEVLAPVAA